LARLESNILEKPQGVIIRSLKQKVLPQVRKKLIEGRHIFTKTLHDSIEARPIFKFGEGETEVVFGYFVPYGFNLEMGSDRESPIFAKILRWVQIKNGVTGKEAERQAYLITRKLRRDGAEPHPVLLPVWEATKDGFFRDVIQKLEVSVFAGTRARK
jgi:hypothetical protein